jgi:hypothetical protein
VIGDIYAGTNEDIQVQYEEGRAEYYSGNEGTNTDESHFKRVDVVRGQAGRLFDLMMERMHVLPQPFDVMKCAVVPIKPEITRF